jgi:hypothetical protein
VDEGALIVLASILFVFHRQTLQEAWRDASS